MLLLAGSPTLRPVCSEFYTRRYFTILRETDEHESRGHVHSHAGGGAGSVGAGRRGAGSAPSAAPPGAGAAAGSVESKLAPQ